MVGQHLFVELLNVIVHFFHLAVRLLKHGENLRVTAVFADPLLQQEGVDAVLLTYELVLAVGEGLELHPDVLEILWGELVLFLQVEDHVIVKDIGTCVLHVDIIQNLMQFF